MSPGTAARRYNTAETNEEITINEDKSRALVPFKGTTETDANKLAPNDYNQLSKFTTET